MFVIIGAENALATSIKSGNLYRCFSSLKQRLFLCLDFLCSLIVCSGVLCYNNCVFADFRTANNKIVVDKPGNEVKYYDGIRLLGAAGNR